MSYQLPARSFLVHHLDVGTALQTAARAAEKNPTHCLRELQAINDYLLYIEGRHQRSLHPNEIAQLEQARKKLTEVSFPTSHSIATGRNELAKPFSFTSVFLLRHPEKPSEQDPKNPHLSTAGVHQARAFADYLVEELLLCPRPINIFLYCSDLRRTFLYGMVVREQILRAQRQYGKQNITISQVTQHPALYARFSKAADEEIRPDHSKDPWQAFQKWLQGKYKLAPDPQPIAREVEAWVREQLKVSSEKSWTIILGFSHSFILDTFLQYKIKAAHSAIIGLADYIRFTGAEMNYLGRWYEFLKR